MVELSPATQDKIVLSFPELVAKIEKRHESLAANPRYQRGGAKLAVHYLNKLDDLRRRNLIKVELEIPKKLSRQLRANKVFRKGGVLRRTGSGEVVKHLKEIRPSNVRKLARSLNVAFVVVDALESVLLDEKLKEILEVVRSIEAKLDAQNRGKLKGALAGMQDIPLIHDSETKRQRICLIQNSLKEAEWVFREEYENRWKKYSQSRTSFDSAWITNATELQQMQEQAGSLVESLEPIVLCQLGHTQLYVELNEYVSAEKGAEHLTAFLAENVERFKQGFGEASLAAKEPKHKRLLNIGREKRFSEFRDNVLEPMERIESLLNETLVYQLTIPEEIVSPTDGAETAIGCLDAPRKVTLWDRLSVFALSIYYKMKALWSALCARLRGASSS
jgi:hypothetical protein